MIEVHARLISGPVFLAGETVECHVSFSSPFRCLQSQSNSDIEEVLAWASAQIHCQCTVNDAVVQFPTSASQEELATASTDTSFLPCKGESGHVVLSTKPKILFCDLKLLPGQNKTYIYKEVIPRNAPPTYRGQNIKYAYKITIGTQRVNCVIKLLKIPIRVLVMYGFREFQGFPESTEMQVTPTNPFLQSEQKQSILAMTLQALDNVTARRSPSYFNITNQNGKVVRFCLLKSSFRLGEDIIGIFDFTKSTVKCVQVSVTLVSEEELKEESRKAGKQSVMTVAYNKYHEFCLYLAKTQMILPIPLMITPAFTTDIVSLKWRLHFEFVTTDMLPSKEESVDESMWQGPEKLNVQTMVWDLPINIFPTHPLQVAHGIPTKLEHMITI